MTQNEKYMMRLEWLGMNNSKQEETLLGVLEGFKGSKSFGNNFNRASKEENTLFKIYLEILKISFKIPWEDEEAEGNQHSQNLKEEKTSL